MYVATTKDMLANAYNNWPHKPAKICVMPRETLDAKRDFYAVFDQRHGYLTLPVETVPTRDLRAAMDHYRKSTDWSAFKPRDWQAAYETLEGS